MMRRFGKFLCPGAESHLKLRRKDPAGFCGVGLDYRVRRALTVTMAEIGPARANVEKTVSFLLPIRRDSFAAFGNRDSFAAFGSVALPSRDGQAAIGQEPIPSLRVAATTRRKSQREGIAASDR